MPHIMNELTPTKTKHVNHISDLVVCHQKAIACYNMLLDAAVDEELVRKWP